jgi:hypothetical protein
MAPSEVAVVTTIILSDEDRRRLVRKIEIYAHFQVCLYGLISTQCC